MAIRDIQIWSADVACPFFLPVKRFEEGVWLHPSRLPLGSPWQGCCTAAGDAAISTAGELEQCNLGYASNCSRLPRERQWDAVRFAVSSDHESRVCLTYVCEKNHQPGGNGRLEFSVVTDRWVTSHPDPRIQKMAECFLESWRSRSRKITDGQPTSDLADNERN
jgi:hypothetical protein